MREALLLCQIGTSPAGFGELSHLPLAQVRTTQASEYMALLGGVNP